MLRMSDPSPTWPAPIPLSELQAAVRRGVDLRPDAATRARLAEQLGILGIRKLRMTGDIRAISDDDWLFQGELGATVVQECVVTLEPVTTRIDEKVTRYFAADIAEPEPGSETEMPQDDTFEPLGDNIDPGRIMAEALALALPAFPRKADARPEALNFTEPGKTAMSDEQARPFAGLAALKKRPPDKGGH